MATSRYAREREAKRFALTKDLVTHVADLKETSRNHKVAVDFVLSNLDQHQFLDADPTSVKKTYAGIVDKMKLHSQIAKSNMLNDLTHELWWRADALEYEGRESVYSVALLLHNLSGDVLSTTAHRDRARELQAKADNMRRLVSELQQSAAVGGATSSTSDEDATLSSGDNESETLSDWESDSGVEQQSQKTVTPSVGDDVPDQPTEATATTATTATGDASFVINEPSSVVGAPGNVDTVGAAGGAAGGAGGAGAGVSHLFRKGVSVGPVLGVEKLPPGVNMSAAVAAECATRQRKAMAAAEAPPLGRPTHALAAPEGASLLHKPEALARACAALPINAGDKPAPSLPFTVVDERILAQEALNMLAGLPGRVFTLHGKGPSLKFVVAPRIAIAHASMSALRHCLQSLCEHGSAVAQIHALCLPPSLSGHTEPRTLVEEALQSSLQRHLGGYNRALQSLGTAVKTNTAIPMPPRGAKDGEIHTKSTSITLIAIESIMGKRFALIRALRVAAAALDTDPDTLPPSRRTSAIFDSLVGLLHTFSAAGAMGLVAHRVTMRLLADVLLPYVDLIERWLYSARLPDPRDELPFALRGASAAEATMRPNAVAPRFLRPLVPALLSAGRALSALLGQRPEASNGGDAEMGDGGNDNDERGVSAEKEDESRPIDGLLTAAPRLGPSLWHIMCGKPANVAASAGAGAIARAGNVVGSSVVTVMAVAGDPLLQSNSRFLPSVQREMSSMTSLAFHSAYKPTSLPMPSSTSVTFSSGFSSLQSAPDIDHPASPQKNRGDAREKPLPERATPLPDGLSLVPVGVLLENSLLSPLRVRCAQLDRALVSELCTRHDLLKHMVALRNVYCLEGGANWDGLHVFANTLFEKLESGEQLGKEGDVGVQLASVLGSIELPKGASLSATFSNTAQPPKARGGLTTDTSGHRMRSIRALDGLTLSYSVAWPVSMLIGSDALSRYNDVMRFLLRIKRAKFALERCPGVRGAGAAGPGNCGRVAQACAPRSMRLRCELLHVVANLQNYAMVRVVHGGASELDAAIAKAASLQACLDVHGKYLDDIRDRCMLNEKVAKVAEAITRILDLALQFRIHHDVLYASAAQAIGQHKGYAATQAAKAKAARAKVAAEKNGPIGLTETDQVDNTGTRENEEEDREAHAAMAEAALLRIESDFSQCTRLVIVVLEKIAAAGHHPHVVDLLTRLNFNDFYSRQRQNVGGL